MAVFTTIRLTTLSILLILNTNSFSQYNFQKTYKGLTFYTGQITADGGYIATGSTRAYGAGSDDFFLLKLNPLGVTEWLKTYGSNGNESAYDIRQTYDGGYAIAGTTYNINPNSRDLFIMKLDSTGNILWSKTYGGIDQERVPVVMQTSDSGFALAGTTESFTTGLFDYYLIRTNFAGDTLWTAIYGQDGYGNVYGLAQADDKGIIIAGEYRLTLSGNVDMHVVKTDSLGNSGCYTTRTNTIVDTPIFQISNFPIYISTGGTPQNNSFSTGNSLCTETVICESVGLEEPTTQSPIEVFPNPSNGIFSVSCELNGIGYVNNSLGELISRIELVAGTNSIDLSDQPNGIYILQICTDAGTAETKLVKANY